MSGSTQDQIFQVENLLRSFGATHGAARAEQAPPTRSWNFDSRPVIAVCFALFVLAPGCAVAAAFLMRTSGDIPAIVSPDRNPPVVTKSDRLPLEQWSAEAAESMSTKDTTRLATAAAMADPSFLSPILIRGSLEDGTLTSLTEPAAMPESIMSPPRPRLRRDVRHARPSKLVTELAPPSEPPPSFLEKLFGPRFH